MWSVLAKVARYFENFVITEGDFADFREFEDILNTIMAGVCVLCAGLAAGLTMGLLSLDETKLELKCRVGNETDKAAAEKVLPIVRRHHLLLVTLLLFNSIANETLPIFLGELVPNYIAILLAVFLILIFGEILPSAFFTGANQLTTSAALIPLVYFLIGILYPIAYPISLALDAMFGEDEDSSSLTRSELEALVIMQQVRNSQKSPLPSEKDSGDQDQSPRKLQRQQSIVAAEDGLSPSEVNLMLGVLNLSKLTVGCAMIPTERVYMISSSSDLSDKEFLTKILHSGFSRILVHSEQNRDHLLGYILVKELIVSQNRRHGVSSKLREPLFVKPGIGLLEMLGIFQEGHCHLAIVTQDPNKAVESLRGEQTPPMEAKMLGIVTLEDVLEKVLQGDIVDETDNLQAEGSNALTRGVVTTQLARRIHRVHTSAELSPYRDDNESPDAKRGRSLSRTRGRSLSLRALNTINVVAGDVRHKNRNPAFSDDEDSAIPVRSRPSLSSDDGGGIWTITDHATLDGELDLENGHTVDRKKGSRRVSIEDSETTKLLGSESLQRYT